MALTRFILEKERDVGNDDVDAEDFFIGNMMPASTTMIEPSQRNAIMCIPNSPSPPVDDVKFVCVHQCLQI
jgi:hypothetical protein